MNVSGGDCERKAFVHSIAKCTQSKRALDSCSHLRLIKSACSERRKIDKNRFGAYEKSG